MNGAGSIKQGFFWLGAASALLRGLDAVGSLLVLLLLSSEAVGLASLSWTVAVVLEAFNGLGVGHSIVRARQIERRELESLFWFALALALAGASAVVAGSGVIAQLFGAPDLRGLIAVSALRLPLVAAALVPLQLLHRNLEFRKLAGVQAAAAALALVAKLGLALAGAGAWSLVIAHTAEALFTLLGVFVVAPFWPTLRFAFADIRAHVSFGLRVAASVVLYHLYRNLDFVLVGQRFGVAALGAYRVAFDLVMVPVMAIVDVMSRSAFPLYARLGHVDPRRAKGVYLWVVKNLVLVVGPLTALFASVGADVLIGVAGPAWMTAAPFVPLLSLAALLRALTQITPPLFHAAGRPELAAYDSLLTLVAFPAFALVFLRVAGAELGPNAVTLGWVAAYAVALVVLRAFSGRVVGLGVPEYARAIGQPLAFASVLLFAGWFVEHAYAGGASPLARVLLKLAVFALLSFAGLRWVFRVRLSQLFARRKPA